MAPYKQQHLQQMSLAQPRSQVRNSPANVQSYLKQLNSPVVLNHELLASYGVSLNNNNNNGQQQSNAAMTDNKSTGNYTQKNSVNIRREDFGGQKIISGMKIHFY